MTYLFYDLETTGLNKSFDQVLQFAAIRTDKSLNEIDRYEIRVRLSADVLPAPQALIIHQILFKNLLTGSAEYEAIKEIYALVNAPGTCSIGYNTLGFDDEFLRFSFYRHLLPPYRHQYANGCSRMDLYPMLPFYYLYQPETLSWPTVNGKLSFKLEALNQENAWVEGQAHDAMVDVEATLALARCLQAQSKQWQYVIKFFNKAQDNLRQQQLPVALTSDAGKHHLGLYINPRLGVAKQMQTQVLSLGQHRHYSNQQLYLDLASAELPSHVLNQDIESIAYIRKKAAEPGFMLPPTPRFIKMDQERLARVKQNLLWLSAHPHKVAALSKTLCDEKYPEIKHIDAQANLYQGGFFSKQEEALFAQFHQCAASEQAALLERFDSNRARELALRLLGRHDPSVLSDSAKTEWQAYFDEVWHDGVRIDHRAQHQANKTAILAEITVLLQDSALNSVQQQILRDYQNYLA